MDFSWQGLISVLLAASAPKRCTSLVCSCYVAARNSDSKEDESNKSRTHNVSLQQSSADKKYRINERSSNNEMVNRRNRSIASNGLEIESSVPLKSNLKKAATTGTRKVSWSDAHGKDIALVQEFDSR
ncbi:uncharacterized protein Fot_30952 [Forsythia ovata]|uniref:Uncharacterized protein n=1 Tax=Forsythia ovata TaxID=205694 RepID=A0ABD1T3V6_9LAMI